MSGRLSTVALSSCAAANLIVLTFLAARIEDFSCFTRLQLRPDTPPNGAKGATVAPQTEAVPATAPSPLNLEDLARFDLKQAANGIRASDWCRESCRATFHCEEHEVKLCYWHEHATCTCRDELFFPSEWFRGALKSTKAKAQSGPKLHP